MNARERAVLDALLPSGASPELPLGLFEAGFDEFYAGFRKTAPLGLRLGFKAALLAAAWLSPPLIGRLPPITRLSREDAERALEALGRSRLYPVRQTVLVLKAVASFCYGAHPRVRAAVGAYK